MVFFFISTCTTYIPEDTEEVEKLKLPREKPSLDFDVSMGINVLKKSSVTSLIEKDNYLDLPDLMTKISKRNPQSVSCYKEKCEWLDMGRIDDYSIATELFEENRSLYLGSE